MALLGDTRTIAELSEQLFGAVDCYNALLALEAAGAHVEYLFQRGLLAIDNLEQIDKSEQIIPIQYRSLDRDTDFDLSSI